MRAPLVFAGPGIPAGKRSAAMCYLLDIFPTLGALAGIAVPEGSEGRSLAPVLAGKSDALRDTVFTAYTTAQRAVRDERWKLIAYPRINRTQLFDLERDPDERHDLAADSRHTAQLTRLTALLREQQALAGDTLPLTTDKPQPADFDFTKVKRPAAPAGAPAK